MEQLGFHWKDFHEIWYLSIFGNLFRRLKFHWNLTIITGTLREGVSTFMVITRSVLLRMKSIWDKRCRENQNTHFTFSSPHSPRKLCRLWDNTEKFRRADEVTDDNMIWCMTFAFWSTKVSNTHSEYVIPTAFFFFKDNSVSQTHLDITLYFVVILFYWWFILTAPWEGRIISVNVLASTRFSPNLRYCCGKWRKDWGKQRITRVRMANLFMVRGWCRKRNTQN